jgi:hypothetical protein
MSEELNPLPLPERDGKHWQIYRKDCVTFVRYRIETGSERPLTADERLVDELCQRMVDEIAALKKELANKKDAHELCHGLRLTLEKDLEIARGERKVSSQIKLQDKQ